jgi:hypothetical protein
MKLVRFAVLSIAILFLLLTAIGLLFPSTVRVSRAVDVTASDSVVRANVLALQAWPTWLVLSTDSTQIPRFEKATPQLLQMGSTEARFVAKTDTSITVQWTGKNNPGMLSTLTLYHSNMATKTVVWQFQEELAWYPWERFGSMVYDKVLGGMMELSLQKCKQNCEAQNQVNP